jgi:DNA helicase HerA-like ATPase
MSDSLTLALSPDAEGFSPLELLPRMANRHGLVAGATGTGKTVTLRVMAEAFSRAGVPVFMADVKGDLSGLARPGAENPKLRERLDMLKLQEHVYEGFPVVFWDVFGEQGHPVRTTITDMGPLLLSRLLNLNDTQAGVLSLVFKVADDRGLLLLDLKDLRAMLAYIGDHAAEVKTQYGNVSAASVGAIQRNLLALEEQGGDRFFGEPALDLDDFLQTDAKGRGIVNILAADKLMLSPKLYATFLLWLLAELFERLPEVGDPEKPKIAFFFDEAHLLFDEAPEALMEKIEQVVRLVRSKGVGIYFCSQNPLDIPDKVLGQLGNRVQHALRAFTPRDQKAVKAAAETFRANADLDVATVIMELAVGEALVSFLDAKGTPNIVRRAWVMPPSSQFPPLEPTQRKAVVDQSTLAGHYEKLVDRESAFELLKAKTEAQAQEQASAAEEKVREREERSASRGPDSALESFGKGLARAAGSSVGRALVRGVLGSIFGGTKGRSRGLF